MSHAVEAHGRGVAGVVGDLALAVVGLDKLKPFGEKPVTFANASSTVPAAQTTPSSTAGPEATNGLGPKNELSTSICGTRGLLRLGGVLQTRRPLPRPWLRRASTPSPRHREGTRHGLPPSGSARVASLPVRCRRRARETPSGRSRRRHRADRVGLATAPIEYSSGGRSRHRLSRRGNRHLNHALHLAALCQIRQPAQRAAPTSSANSTRAKPTKRPYAL